jgi:hypothetical protein
VNLARVIQFRNVLIGRSLETSVRKAEFRVVDVSERGVTIRPQGSDKDRPIRSLEVELMGERWEEYKAGLVTRSELANGNPKIFNTSYLESIFYDIDSHGS